MKTVKFFFVSLICLMVFSATAQDYVDLGLPSGTLWKDRNEPYFYTYAEAVSAFGSRLPTRLQLEELVVKCDWEYMEDGYRVIGPNGNSIFLPADGYRDSEGKIMSQGFYASSLYWSSTPSGSDSAWFLYISPANGVHNIDDSMTRDFGFYVRLVQ
ncbi:MAG: hypothetical protein J5642_00415 [Bacteroidales bacterium]|nr:hypothetical protein [Bacteroidales bacterium]